MQITQMAPQVIEVKDKQDLNIRVPEYAVLNLCVCVKDMNIELVRAEHVITVEAGGQCMVWLVLFGGIRNTVTHTVRLAGEGASMIHRTIFLGTQDQSSTVFINVIHEAENTNSKLEAKGIVKDTAYARYNGMIRMEKTAKGACGSLDQDALMLSDTAKIEAIPGLEIGTNDVRASHSARMTKVDREQLFYAASRGISEEMATLMIAEGFLKPIIDSLFDAQLRQNLIKAITNRLTA